MSSQASTAAVERSDDHRTMPVFVVGCHRSGSTLLRYLLDTHPNIACAPETKVIAAMAEALVYPQVLRGLETIGVDGQAAVRGCGHIFDKLLHAYARRQGKNRWVDKTPNYYRLLPFIEQMFSGNVAFIFLSRHPFDTVASLERYFVAADHDDPDIRRAVGEFGRSRAGWAKYWKSVYESIDEFRVRRSIRSLWCRYEDLVSSPSSELDRIFSFLGEEKVEGIVQRAFVQAHTDGYGDAKIKDARGVYDGNVQRWRSWPPRDVESVWRIVEEAARRYGYEPGTASSSVSEKEWLRV